MLHGLHSPAEGRVRPAVRVPVSLLLLTAAALMPRASTQAAETNSDGVALAILYDTSGSMQDSVPDGSGKPTPKYLIANRALAAIADKLEAFATNSDTGTSHRIDAGLFIFEGSGAREVVKFGSLDAPAMRDWAKSFASPVGGTPLGNALRQASKAVLRSPLSRKHVLVITDGINTVGPAPAAVMPGLKREADRQQSAISFHFVAFDVSASVFDPVKRAGATVEAAADEKQLNTQLNFILQQQILLEKEGNP